MKNGLEQILEDIPDSNITKLYDIEFRDLNERQRELINYFFMQEYKIIVDTLQRNGCKGESLASAASALLVNEMVLLGFPESYYLPFIAGVNTIINMII